MRLPQRLTTPKQSPTTLRGTACPVTSEKQAHQTNIGLLYDEMATAVWAFSPIEITVNRFAMTTRCHCEKEARRRSNLILKITLDVLQFQPQP